MYRVYQAYDSVIKQNAARKIQAAMRNNATIQRYGKPTNKSLVKINRDATIKAKKVIKEVSVDVSRPVSGDIRASCRSQPRHDSLVLDHSFH